VIWQVPLFKLHFEDEEKQAVLEVLDSGWISAGEKTRAFEEQFAAMTGARHAVAVNSGTAALHLCALALGIGPGDEVIVPSLTFAATANAMYYTGARPVFADIVSPEDLTISPRDIERKITKRTKAIVVMHYGGFACDLDEIIPMAESRGLTVIEDAAHAPGARHHGKALGTFGSAGAFSFYSNKNITTAEGGMVVTDSDQVARQAALLRSHGMTASSYDRAMGHASTYDIAQVGYNYRLDDIRAAIGIVQLGRLTDDLDRRKSLVALYHRRLSEIGGITVPFLDKVEGSSNYILPIVLNEGCRIGRDELRQRLEADFGIQTSVHYQPVHKFSQYSDPASVLPVTEHVAALELTLPLFYGMQEAEVDYVCSSLMKILSE